METPTTTADHLNPADEKLKCLPLAYLCYNTVPLAFTGKHFPPVLSVSASLACFVGANNQLIGVKAIYVYNSVVV